MAYTTDILGLIEEVRDTANTGHVSTTGVPRTEYHLIKHIRDLLGGDGTHYPDGIYGLLQEIRDLLAA